MNNSPYRLAARMLEEFVDDKGILERHRNYFSMYNHEHENHKVLQELELKAIHIFAQALINHVTKNPVIIYQPGEEPQEMGQQSN
jgi:hypothetical protein